MNILESLSPLCAAINDLPGTLISTVWLVIVKVFESHEVIVVLLAVIWVLFEVVTRDTHSYNSENGFTPVFNSVVGGGVFYGMSWIIDAILGFFLGNTLNCTMLWVNTFYLVPFIATGLLLHGVGFWPYIKFPIIGIQIDLIGKGRRW